MELYISDHPLDCLTCPANGDCELQDMAGVVGLRDVRYGYDGANHLDAQKDESNPYFTLRPVASASSAPLRARLRGDAGHVRADDQRPRLRLARRRRARTSRSWTRECVSLRRLRAGLPDRDAAWKSRSSSSGQPEHSVITTCAYCGVGCAFKAEMKGDEVVRMVP